MKIPHLAGLIYWWDCHVENLFIKKAPLPSWGIWQGVPRDIKVTVSLTTFPKRIDACYYAIKSLMLQTYKADHIILWLAEEQFQDHILPSNYQELIKRGLEIRYCDDLRSHKKYFYALQEQKKNEVVITFDDDIIFDGNAIHRLMEMYRRFPNCVICNRGHHITSADGKIETYRNWKICSPEGVGVPSMKIMPSTGAGCLYPYGTMPPTTFDKQLLLEYAPTADDIWMCFNRISAGVPAIKTREKSAILCTVFNSQEEALTVTNDIGHENERTIERLTQLFPDVFQKSQINR